MSRIVPFDVFRFMHSRPMFDYNKYPILKEKGQWLIALFKMSEKAFMIENHKGELLAVIGILKMWDGVFEIYIVPTLAAHSNEKGVFVRAVLELKKKLDKFKEEFDIRRLQTIAPNDEAHNRWMEAMGFFSEGVLRNYGINCEDHRLWSKLWE